MGGHALGGRNLAPMIPEPVAAPFSSPDFTFEPKWDGIRCLAFVEGGRVRLLSRSGRDMTAQFPELQALGRGDAGRAIDGWVIDGELVSPVDGRPDFDAVMRRRLAAPRAVPREMERFPATLMVFDVLTAGGRDVRRAAIERRRAELDRFPLPGGAAARTPVTDGDGTAVWESVRALGLEGMVAKRKGSAYVGRRSRDWLKVKNYTSGEYLVVGFRKAPFAVVVAGRLDGRDVKGTVELGIGPGDAEALAAAARPLIAGRSGDVLLLEPALKCRVRACGVTYRGSLREPVFEGFAR